MVKLTIIRAILTARLPTLEQQREGGITVKGKTDAIKTEETHWRDLAERAQQAEKKLLYESIADVAALKADELRLRANVRPEGELARNIVEEESENNDLTRFERFKRGAKRNLGWYFGSCDVRCGNYYHHSYGCKNRREKRCKRQE